MLFRSWTQTHQHTSTRSRGNPKWSVGFLTRWPQSRGLPPSIDGNLKVHRPRLLCSINKNTLTNAMWMSGLGRNHSCGFIKRLHFLDPCLSPRYLHLLFPGKRCFNDVFVVLRDETANIPLGCRFLAHLADGRDVRGVTSGHFKREQTVFFSFARSRKYARCYR